MNLRAAAAILLLALAAPLSAQEVRLEGRTSTPAVRLARQILAEGEYLLLDRDTVLPESFRAPGDVVVVDADVKLEGMVEGRVAVLGGDLFVRPGARVGGPVAVVGGGFYPSGLAEIGEVVEGYAPLQVTVATDTLRGDLRRVRIIPPPPPSRLAFPGVAGLRVPTYNRVDGLTLAWGPRWRLGGGEEGARADAWASYRTARGDFGGGAELWVPFAARGFAAVRAAKETATHDAWIRGDLSNTLAAIGVGTDERDYYEAERLSLTLGLLGGQPLLAGEYEIAPRASLLLEDAESLATEDPWSLFGDLDDFNLPVNEGTIASAIAGVGFRWQGRVSAFRGEATLEHGFADVGDFQFTQGIVDGHWTSLAFRTHEVSVSGHGMWTFGSDPAPLQRWSFVGGSSTLPTFDTAELRGDRLVYLESWYGVPLPRLALPILGPPFLRFSYRTGTAWITGTDIPEWLQNVGARLDFGVVHAGVFVDPTDLSPDLSFGLALPPWP